jgi:hypothetical protein
MGEFQEETNAFLGRKLGKVAIAIVGLMLVWMLFASIFSFWPLSVAKQVVNKVVNADSIVANYQWFYDQKAAIDSQRVNWANMPKDAPERNSMLMVLNNAITEYNSRSKQITRNLWKASDLPYSIPFEVNK